MRESGSSACSDGLAVQVTGPNVNGRSKGGVRKGWASRGTVSGDIPGCPAQMRFPVLPAAAFGDGRGGREG